MPTTSTGEYVYTPSDEVLGFVQAQPENFGLATTSNSGNSPGVSEWQEFVEQRQIAAKSRIDNYAERDFENHAGETVEVSTSDGETAIYVTNPIRNITEVRVSGSPLESDSYTTNGSGMLVKTTGVWSDDFATVEVTGDFGYQTPPEDIQRAEKLLTGHMLIALAQKREGAVIDVEDNSVALSMPSSMTKEVRRIIDRHRHTGVFR